MRQLPPPDEIAINIKTLTEEETGKYVQDVLGIQSLSFCRNDVPEVVLGSRSPRRELILGNLLGITHKCLVLDVNEHLPEQKYPPEVISKCLTLQKLIVYLKNRKKVIEKGNVLIVSDTIVIGKNGEIMGKEPDNLRTEEEKYKFCYKRIMNLMGNRTAVFSSVAVADLREGKILVGCDSVIIHFKPVSKAGVKIVERYCGYVYDKEMIKKHRGPLGKAGSFGIQEPEILCLVKKVKGDITVAVGLPADLTLRFLNLLHGFRLPARYDGEHCINTVFANAIIDKEYGKKNLREIFLK